MQYLSPTFVLPKLLQKDQLTVNDFLDKASLYVNTQNKKVSNLEKFVYSRAYGVEAFITSLKDPVLYPVQGVFRCVFSVISWNGEEGIQGLKDICVHSFQALALSIYLLGVSVLGLIWSTSIYGSISTMVDILAEQRSKEKETLLAKDLEPLAVKETKQEVPLVDPPGQAQTPPKVEKQEMPGTILIKQTDRRKGKQRAEKLDFDDLPLSADSAGSSSEEGEDKKPIKRRPLPKIPITSSPKEAPIPTPPPPPALEEGKKRSKSEPRIHEKRIMRKEPPPTKEVNISSLTSHPMVRKMRRDFTVTPQTLEEMKASNPDMVAIAERRAAVAGYADHEKSDSWESTESKGKKDKT